MNHGGHVVVGATSEIARAIVRRLAERGQGLVVAARDEQELQRLASDTELRGGARVIPIPLDVTEFDKHQEFLNACRAALGDVEGIIICQGFMADQDEAAADWSLMRKMIEVNFSSAVSLANVFAAHMAAKRRGYICGISSVAGDRGRQSNFLYGSTKAGFSTYLDGLRCSLFRRGVAVITVKPGFVDTSMTWGMLNPKSPLLASPDRIAYDVCRAIRRRKGTLYTPWFWWPIMAVIRHLPESLFKRLPI